MKTIGAIVGAGAMAREHLVAMKKVVDGEIVAVCDLSPVRAEMTAERYGLAHWFDDMSQMLAETNPHIVHITAPPQAHFPLAKACLEQNIHVICEKPVTVRYADFLALRNLARDRRLMLLENQNYRYHSTIRRLTELRASGAMGDIVDVQIAVHLNVVAAGSPFVDRNVPHWSLGLKGGVVGDFLTHMVYVAQLFAGRTGEMCTRWEKREADSPLPHDEFRALAQGADAPIELIFSGRAQPNGFWVRLSGTRMHAEANLFEPPRITLRRQRSGTPPIATFVDGLAEAAMVAGGTVAGLTRKVAGTARYDGLAGFLRASYAALSRDQPPPVSLDEIDQIARTVDALSKPENGC